MPGRVSGSLLLLLALAPPLAACTGGTGAFGHRDPDPSGQLYVPSQVSGGNRGGGRAPTPSAAKQQTEDQAQAERLAAKAEAEKAAAENKAENLWNQAQATPNPSAAAKLYGKLSEDHKDSPHAEEATWLYAKYSYEAGDWTVAVTTLDKYLKAYPVNAHLRECEQILYQSSLNIFEAARGLKGIFKSDKKGYEGLNLVVERFPQGSYPDDALLALGDVYRRKDELPEACLAYRNLLLRYPDSEWSFQARLRLADTYLARDQGPDYNAGYVDLDPRGPTTPQYAASRPIKPCVEAALDNYQTYIDRIEADPARCAEYGDTVAYATRQIENCRARMAAKAIHISNYYARAGRSDCAATYQKFAENATTGRPWCEAIPSAPTGGSAVAPGPTPAPAETPPRPAEAPAVLLPPPPPAAPPPPAVPPAPSTPPLPPVVVPPPQPVPPTYTPPPPRPPSPPATSPTIPGVLPPPRHIPSTATVVK